MPQMGVPSGLQKNRFKNVTMKNSYVPNSLKRNDNSKEELLNRAAGRRAESRFVDGKRHNQIGKDDFLKLLTAQLQHQDPGNPMDQKDFAADLAQFSQLEQLTNLNSKFDKANENGPDEKKFFGASFLGKEIFTSGTTLNYDGQSRTVEIPFSLKQPAAQVRVRIFDNKNNLVAQVERENMPTGPNTIIWDGAGLDGATAVKGEYTIAVDGWDEGFNKFPGETKNSGIVSGVNFNENGETILTIDGQKRVFLRDVESFKLPGHNKPTQLKQNNVQAVQNKVKQIYGGQQQPPQM